MKIHLLFHKVSFGPDWFLSFRREGSLDWQSICLEFRPCKCHSWVIATDIPLPLNNTFPTLRQAKQQAIIIAVLLSVGRSYEG